MLGQEVGEPPPESGRGLDRAWPFFDEVHMHQGVAAGGGFGMP